MCLILVILFCFVCQFLLLLYWIYQGHTINLKIGVATEGATFFFNSQMSWNILPWKTSLLWREIFKSWHHLLEKSENNSPQHSHQTHTTIQQMKTYMCNKAWSQRIGGQGWGWLEGQKMGWGGGWLYLWDNTWDSICSIERCEAVYGFIEFYH